MEKTIAAVEKISRGIVRVSGLNPGPFTLQGTNTYIIGHGSRRVLVDTGDGGQSQYFELLRQCLGTSRINRILLTHWHADHIGGVNSLLEMPDIVASGCTVHKRLGTETDEQSEVKRMLARAVERGCLHYISDSQVFTVDDWRVQAVFTPGHTPDHVAFSVSSEEDAGPALLTGDHILGQGTTVVHELQSYMESLGRVLSIKPTALLPGHGPVISGKYCAPGEAEPCDYRSIRVIEEYIRHRFMRERQILDVLAQPPMDGSTVGWRLEDITRAVYKDITDPKIILAAQNNTLLHLRKLAAESRVQQMEDGDREIRWALIEPSI
ncbi:Beta-lactamase-like protein 2 [Coemansia sp. BCRC 34301]|nr:Beta-lactamase-like protein 2 [Coemansia sp. BCRC 34301]